MAPLFILDTNSFHSTAKSTVWLFSSSPLLTEKVGSVCNVRIWHAVDSIKSFKLFNAFGMRQISAISSTVVCLCALDAATSE